MHTAQVAERAGVNPQTLRYYERRGLLPDPGRSPSGYRRYAPDAVRIVRFIKRAQQLGCDLNQVRLLLELAGCGPDDPSTVERLAIATITELEGRIATLQAMRTCLQRLVATCTRPPRKRDCPLLEATP